MKMPPVQISRDIFLTLQLRPACYPGVTQDTFSIMEIELSVGAGEGIRTLDPDLGKVVLYP